MGAGGPPCSPRPRGPASGWAEFITRRRLPSPRGLATGSRSGPRGRAIASSAASSIAGKKEIHLPIRSPGPARAALGRVAADHLLLHAPGSSGDDGGLLCRGAWRGQPGAPGRCPFWPGAASWLRAHRASGAHHGPGRQHAAVPHRGIRARGPRQPAAVSIRRMEGEAPVIEEVALDAAGKENTSCAFRRARNRAWSASPLC